MNNINIKLILNAYSLFLGVDRGIYIEDYRQKVQDFIDSDDFVTLNLEREISANINSYNTGIIEAYLYFFAQGLTLKVLKARIIPSDEIGECDLLEYLLDEIAKQLKKYYFDNFGNKKELLEAENDIVNSHINVSSLTTKELEEIKKLINKIMDENR